MAGYVCIAGYCDVTRTGSDSGDGATVGDRDVLGDPGASGDNAAHCGDGVCDAAHGEDGGNCPADCCDELTPCNQTFQGVGLLYCYRVGTGAYQWQPPTARDDACVGPGSICAATYTCGGTTYFCKSVSPVVWGDSNCSCGDGVCSAGREDCVSCSNDCGSCAVCGDGNCEGAKGENGASCGQDCCDAQTSCTQSYENQNQLYCYSLNDDAYTWRVESDSAAACSSPSDTCMAKYSCAGSTYWCKQAGVSPNWQASACSCGDGICSFPVETASCQTDCPSCGYVDLPDVAAVLAQPPSGAANTVTVQPSDGSACIWTAASVLTWFGGLPTTALGAGTFSPAQR